MESLEFDSLSNPHEALDLYDDDQILHPSFDNFSDKYIVHEEKSIELPRGSTVPQNGENDYDDLRIPHDDSDDNDNSDNYVDDADNLRSVDDNSDSRSEQHSIWADKSSEHEFDSKWELDWKSNLGESIPHFDIEGRNLLTTENRIDMITQLRELWEERGSLKIKNAFLHKKCRDVLSRPKIMTYFEKSSGIPSIHTDEKYGATLNRFEETKVDVTTRGESCRKDVEALENKYEDHVKGFETSYQEFTLKETEISVECFPKLGDRKMQPWLRKQQQRLDQLIETRIKFLKLRNFLESIFIKIGSFDKVGEGQTILHYENLLATKHIAADRLDEREDDVLEMQKKCFTTVPILAHVKETLNCFAQDVKIATNIISEIDHQKQTQRFSVVQNRKRRDGLRKKSEKFHRSAFLLMDPKLMKIMITSVQDLSDFKSKVDDLQLLLKKGKLKMQ